MLQPQSIVTVADNSGAKVARVFKVLGGSKRRYAQLGDVVVVSIQTAEPRKAVKKKDIYKAVVVRQNKPYRRANGSYVRFDDNAVVLIEKQGKEMGRRVTASSVRCLATSLIRDGRRSRLSRRKSSNLLRMKMKLKKGDTVVVISGKDKGKQGTIEHVYPATNKVVVEGVALS
jgi:large subunit ribosomal protein L14